MHLVLDVGPQRHHRALNRDVEQPGLHPDQQCGKQIQSQRQQQRAADGGEVHAVARHHVHARQQVGERVVAARPRRRDRLLLGQPGGQLAPDHAVEQQVGGVAEDARADHPDRDAAATPSRSTIAVSPRCGVSRLTSRMRRSLEVARPLRRRLLTTVGRNRPRHRMRPERLRVGELGVGRAVGQQRLVRADADHLAVVDDDNLVGLGDRRNALRHNDHRRVRGDLAQRGADPRVGVDVERGERVVEQVDRRPADHRARDRQPLPLPAGEVDAALRDPHLQPVGVGADEVVGRRHPQRLPHLVVGRVGLAVAQVVGDRAGEQVAPLRHQADRRPQLLGVVVADVDAVDEHRAAGDVVQPADQRDQRRLARTGRPDDGRGGARSRRSAKHPAAQGDRRRDS